jgi:hypothetical protein
MVKYLHHAFFLRRASKIRSDYSSVLVKNRSYIYCRYINCANIDVELMQLRMKEMRKQNKE